MRSLLAATLLAAACGGAPHSTEAPPAVPPDRDPIPEARPETPEERRAAACSAQAERRRFHADVDAPAATTIGKVEVTGVPDGASKIQSRAGDALDPAKVRRDAESLWRAYAPEDVRVELVGDTLRFIVVPEAAIREVYFEGFDALAAGDAGSGLSAGSSAAGHRLHAAAGALRDRYVELGRPLATVSVVARRTGEHADVCVKVDEGPRVTVTSVDFAGNAEVTDAELIELVKGDGKVNVPGGRFDRARLDYATLVIEAHYYDRGMILATVDSSATDPTREKPEIALRFDIKEGKVFTLGKLAVEGDLATPQAAYLKVVTTKPGAVFARSQLKEDLERIRKLHQKKSGNDAMVVPLTKIHQDRGVVDLTIQIGGR